MHLHETPKIPGDTVGRPKLSGHHALATLNEVITVVGIVAA
jgi:hypothetical protein